MTTFLDVSAYLGEGFLHPGGRAATRALTDFLDIQPGHRVLDIGCGTGGTATLIAHNHQAQLIAVDQSPVMLSVASARISQHCLAESVHLVRADISQGVPLADSAIDAAYAESSIALMDPGPVLADCLRVLRPGGKLVLNERIWKPGVTRGLAQDINAISRHAFGIPAATPQPLDRDGWIALLQSIGFSEVRSIPTREIASKLPDSIPRRRFARYRRYFRRPALVVPTLRYQFMIRRYREYWSMLDNYLFFARKPE